jgi:PmbA protein
MAGEFSVNLTMAFKIENGELKGSVKDTMLSGNVYNVFKNDPVFGDTLYKKNKYLIPYILANGLSVSS